jgi:4-diphosphocytidyl-2-C-methyl-D-erythritol kinase
MPVFTELARAKINLTLEVLGRRSDGYHELASLVAFADVGDIVTLDTDAPAGTFQVAVSGPFAGALVGDNLISTALRRLSQAVPELKLGSVQLDKRLPVAAGIGGGSADAAAVLRAVRRANSDAAGRPDAVAQRVPWREIAASLGADVPVCLASQTAWMSGIGDRLQPIPGLPSLNAVLVNALGPVPTDKTARVFRALNAPLLAPGGGAPVRADGPTNWPMDQQTLLLAMRERGNDLEMATRQVVPDVATVLRELRGFSGSADDSDASATPALDPQLAAPLLAAMSGAGPTCFAIYNSAAAAGAAAAELRQRQTGWWIAVSRTG